MKPAQYKIETNEQLLAQINSLGLKPAASIQSICVELIDKAYKEKRSSVKIEIHKSMLSDSYLIVAAMFARTFERRCAYTVVHSFLRGNFMVVYAGEHKIPTTFKARAIRQMRKKGHFIVMKDIVPQTYRDRPGTLASILSNELGVPVAFSAKSKGKPTYTWTTSK